MLPTCNRCRKRKTKCDRLLPGCRSCTVAGLECIFYDHASRTNIPRSYVAELDARIHQLKNELKSLRDGVEPIPAPTSLGSSPRTKQLPIYYDGSLNELTRLCLVINEPSDIFLGPGTIATISTIAIRAAVDAGLETLADMTANMRKSNTDSVSHVDVSKLDRSSISLSTIRDLVENHFVRKIHPNYPVVDLNDLQLDTTRLTKLPMRRRFVVIMAAAIAAASLGRNQPEMHTNALILRHWADELANPVLTDAGLPRLQEILLLILYELVDPSRSLIWNLLGLACRICIKLGWHRNAGYVPIVEEGDNGLDDFQEKQRRTVLFIVLYELERRVCYALGRPTILPDISINIDLLPPLEELATLRILFAQSQLHQRIYETSSKACPYSLDVVDIIQQLEDSTLCNSSWIMLYPICQHLCDSCSTLERWEGNIIRAAISIIDYLFEQHRERQILSIWLATCDAFTAGIILEHTLIKHNSPAETSSQGTSLKSLTRCMSLLSSFAEIWPPGEIYKDVFQKLLEFIMDNL
ncbi:fungal-specific transcription factor domain-containing protein [Xylogone sp. PMI_703]|nr:fungal-specific transcription factor domain-containing protein [Xylogone sp. PMI_703]